jgi:hypothetical protein
MAARKKSVKKPAAKTASGSKAASRKKAPAKKKAAAPRPARAKAKPRAARPKSRPSAAASPTPAKPAQERVAAPRSAAPERPALPAGRVSAEQVTLGHVMNLRPRIHVGFKPSAFIDAKRALADEHFASIEEAARAVSAKAIDISNESQDPFTRR